MVHMLESNFELQTSLVRCICWRLHWSYSCFIGGMCFRQLKIIDYKADCDFWILNFKKNMVLNMTLMFLLLSFAGKFRCQFGNS